MADEPISGLPAATIPIGGDSLMAIVQDGVTVKATLDQVINTLSSSTLTNGVAVSVTNASDTVHSYTIAAENLIQGTVIEYNAIYEAQGEDESPNYRLQLMLGATPYNFNFEQPFIFAGNDNNTRGKINASFQLVSIEASEYISGSSKISLYNPNDGSFATYENTQLIQTAFNIGTDSFSIASFIQSTSATLTVQITGSNLKLSGAQ